MAKEIVEPVIIIGEEEEEVKIIFEELLVVKNDNDLEELVIDSTLPLVEVITIESKIPLESVIEESVVEESVVEEPVVEETVVEEPVVEETVVEEPVVEEPVVEIKVIKKNNSLRLYQKVKYTPKLFGVIVEIKKKYDKTYYRVQFENSEMSSWFKESNLKVETIADIKERLGFR